MADSNRENREKHLREMGVHLSADYVELEDGTTIHRVRGGGLLEESPCGALDLYHSGQLHNENGPAILWPDGTKFWYFNGLRHRENGPAVEWASGTKEYYLFGQKCESEQDFKATMELLRFVQEKEK